MPVTVVIHGIPEAVKMTALYQEGARALGETRVLIGTTVEYAIYQEEGTRSLRGVHYLRNALDAITPGIAASVGAVISRGGAAVVADLRREGFKVQALAQQAAPVDTGNLRGSIHTTSSGRL